MLTMLCVRLALVTGAASGCVGPSQQRHQRVLSNLSAKSSRSSLSIAPRHPPQLRVSGRCTLAYFNVDHCTDKIGRWNEMKIVRSFKSDPHPSIIPFHSFIITPSYALITMYVLFFTWRTSVLEFARLHRVGKMPQASCFFPLTTTTSN